MSFYEFISTPTLDLQTAQSFWAAIYAAIVIATVAFFTWKLWISIFKLVKFLLLWSREGGGECFVGYHVNVYDKIRVDFLDVNDVEQFNNLLMHDLNDWEQIAYIPQEKIGFSTKVAVVSKLQCVTRGHKYAEDLEPSTLLRVRSFLRGAFERATGIPPRA
ncbi:hypothetical protein D3C72_1264950 [compost metagenome]